MNMRLPQSRGAVTKKGEYFMVLKKIALGLLAGVALGASAQAADIDHVLLISVDGLHALGRGSVVDAHPNSALAELSGHGVTYSNARTPRIRFISWIAGARDRRLAEFPRPVL